MRAPGPGLGPLTVRGAVVTGVGVSLVAVGVATGLPSLVRAGVLAIVLPLLAALALTAARPRASVERTLDPGEVTVGEPSRVRLRVSVTSVLPLHGLLAEDTRSPSLAGRSRFVLATSTAQVRRGAGPSVLPGPGGRDGRDAAVTTVTYRAVPAHRGEHRVGPLRISVTDPLGLVRGAAVPVQASRRAAAATTPQPSGRAREGRSGATTLLALPEALPLTTGRGVGGPAGSSGSSTSSTRSGEERASGVREYLPGDDVRRIHWRATARADQLMVSQEEEPPTQRAVLVLDTSGRWSPASFERAVVAAASVLAVLGAGGRPVELHAGGQVSWGPVAHLLRVLALIEVEGAGSPHGASVPGRARAGAPPAGVTRTVRVVSGDDPPAPAAAAVPSGAASAPAVLVVDGRGDPPPVSAALLAAGWRVALVPRGSDLAQALPRAWAALESPRGAADPASARRQA